MKENTDKQNNENEINDLLAEAFDVELPTELSNMSAATASSVLDQTKRMMSTVVQFKELMMRYDCAIKEVRTKFDVLNTEFKVRYSRNPINFISSRLKSTSSITEKLARNGIDFTVPNIEENLNDVAGIRIICSYVDDIYMLAEALTKQDDITTIAVKDYIKKPKPNGYRSLHLIVSIPVFFAEQTKQMKVEVQIRTIAMDFWASLEHQLKYKHEITDNQQSIIEQLKLCANVISTTDAKMLDIRKQIEAETKAPTEDELLFEQLKNIDMKIV